MAEARSWLESRHLGRSAEGAHALARLAELSEPTARALLAAADEIARTSVTLAHRFFVAAVRVADERPDRYEWWSRTVSDAASTESGGRALVQALLELDPVALAAVSPAAGERWRRALTRVAAHSGRLAAAYARALGTALSAPGQRRDDCEDLLDSWADTILTTASTTTWRGELLATHVAESARELFDVFERTAVERWAEVVRRVGSTGRSPRLPVYPLGTARGAQIDHASILECALLAAEDSPRAGDVLVAELGAAVAALPSAAARSLLLAVRRAAGAPDLGGTLLLIPAVAHELGAADVTFLCDLAARAAEAVPTALPAFLRSMDRALEAGGREGVEAWLALGIELGVENAAAAVAHFRLETRTAHKLLTQHTAAVAFDEVEGLLQRYTRMLARRSIRVVSAPGLWIRPPLAATGEATLRFPERVDLFPTAEENQAFYLLSAAHGAGRYEYGTQRVLARDLHGAPAADTKAWSCRAPVTGSRISSSPSRTPCSPPASSLSLTGSVSTRGSRPSFPVCPMTSVGSVELTSRAASATRRSACRKSSSRRSS